MVRETFFLKKESLLGFKTYIRENMPTLRFEGNPIECRDSYMMTVTYGISDIGKIGEWRLSNESQVKEKEKEDKPFFKRFLDKFL